MVKHRLYVAYSGMLNRCLNPNNSSYHLYGARGITVCDRWRFGADGMTGFECWLADMGERPEGMTLDRVRPLGPYAPWNCRWADHHEQRINQSEAGKERQRAGAAAGAHARWEKRRAEGRAPPTHCRKGHEYTPENIYIHHGGRTCRQCAVVAAEVGRRKKGIPKRNLKRDVSVRPDTCTDTTRTQLDGTGSNRERK